MIRLVVTGAFALLFTVVTIRLALGGLDAPVVFAALVMAGCWFQVFRLLRRPPGIW